MRPAKFGRLAFSWLFCLATAVNAVPIVDNVKRDVINPPITSPDEDTVWVIGTSQLVTWDTSVFEGQNLSTTQGEIFLGFLNDTSGNEHLDINNPLANGFDIRTGSVHITVPNVDPRDDYIIALLGDTSNISPKFTVTNSSDDFGPITTTMTVTTTTISSSSSSAKPSSTSTKTASTVSTRVIAPPIVSASGSQAGGSTATKTVGTSATPTNSALSNSSRGLTSPTTSLATFVVALVSLLVLP